MNNLEVDKKLNDVIGDRLDDLMRASTGTKREIELLDSLERLYKLKSLSQVDQVNYILKKED